MLSLLRLSVSHLIELMINFPNQIVTIFSKLGCNGGGCHGKASGQNGFKLSLLGYEPEEDYEYLVKEVRGRRLFPAAPERSLLLTKASGQVPHGGGRRMSPEDYEYTILYRWIAQGMPYGKPDDPVIERIEVFPSTRRMNRSERQQLAVTAYYTDGTTEDVTRMAQYEPNDPELASIIEEDVEDAKLEDSIIVLDCQRYFDSSRSESDTHRVTACSENRMTA